MNDMADALDGGKDWEAFDEARMEGAVLEIARSTNLRFFFRSLFNDLGMYNSTFNTDPMTMAWLTTRHEVAVQIQGILSEHDPHIYPSLIKEDADENATRTE